MTDKPNFRIVEQSSHTYDKCLDEFAELYMNMSLTTYDIMKKLDISGNKFYTLRKNCIRYGLIPNCNRNELRPHKHINKKNNSRLNNPKYYYFDKNRYRVRKIIDSKRIHFKSFKIEEEAKDAVKLLKEINWDKEKFLEIMKYRKNEV